MQEKNLNKIKKLLKNKKLLAGVVIVLLVISYFVFRAPKSDVVSIDEVKKVDLVKSVRATGQVISNTNLDLSFNKSGVVRSVRVAVGDVVKKGQMLVTLDQGQALATLTQARGALLGAKAKYNKTIEGASNEEIVLAEVAFKNAQNDLTNTKNNQKILVANSYQSFLNSALEVNPVSSINNTQTMPTITGTYTLGKEGVVNITISQSGSNTYFSTSGLFKSSGVANSITAQPMDDSGLFIKFPSSYIYQGDLMINIPNVKASTYLTNYNAYKSAIETETSTISSAQSLVDQKQAELNLKKASARTADVDIAQADVLSAEGTLQSAESAYEDTIIRAGADGTITKVDVKYGEIADAGKNIVTLQDVNNLYIEALINESNIAYLKLNQPVDITFDAFGSNKKFTGSIIHIDPSSEANDGVVNYKIKVALLGKDETIRPGMNANINVLAGEVKGVLAIANVAVIKKDGKSFVNVITDEKKKKYETREVTTGFLADNNLVEIISGLKAGDKIAFVQN